MNHQQHPPNPFSSTTAPPADHPIMSSHHHPSCLDGVEVQDHHHQHHYAQPQMSLFDFLPQPILDPPACSVPTVAHPKHSSPNMKMRLVFPPHLLEPRPFPPPSMQSPVPVAVAAMGPSIVSAEELVSPPSCQDQDQEDWMTRNLLPHHQAETASFDSSGFEAIADHPHNGGNVLLLPKKEEDKNKNKKANSKKPVPVQPKSSSAVSAAAATAEPDDFMSYLVSLSVTPDQKIIRPLSAYNFFFSEERERLVADRDLSCELTKEQRRWRLLLDQHLRKDRVKRRAHRKTHGKISFTQLSRHIGQAWKVLPESKKAFYREVSKMDVDRYHLAVVKFTDCTTY